ncbi:MAG: SMC domain protein [Limisphaerales bacterium]|nr:MAG: SMC domain protein [Limisphaerales bacterium]KAG0507777.1 MAG: SMC domain protein [Limisphaerales bacterium]TXT51058.1 MAG: SMC domain protein [Limisphaerales bacterium]
MLISSCQITNYKSFRYSQELKFTPGFNVIVGRNNVGKTALIEALRLQVDSKPHRSLETLKTPDAPQDPISSVTMSFDVEKNEFTNILAKSGVIEVPVIHNQSVQHSAHTFLDVVNKPMTFKSRWENGDFQRTELAGFGPGFGGPAFRLKYDSTEARFKLGDVSTVHGGSPNQTFARQLSFGLRERIYVFRAERLNVSQSQIGTTKQLEPDAKNLASVLHLLQSNVARFERFNEYVRTIFPDIKQVTTRPVSSTVAEILVWSVDPDTEREDLAIPLSDCGTGIGQVLAMLYAVTNSEFPRTIVIDEPQSFLHPGAIQKLFGIFRRHPEHQFIVSTHSPTVVTAANPSTLLLLTREGNETKTEVLNVKENSELRLFLSEVGARLSDVFGADNILWVEGRTEEICFRLIAAKLLNAELQLLGTEIIGVKQVGDLEGRHAKTVLEIYKRLCQGRGLLPPALAFSFDRDGRSEQEMVDLKQESKGLIHFIPRKMFENYLLNSKAIAEVLNEADIHRQVILTESEVENWLEARRMPEAGNGRPDENWVREVDAAKLLRDLFNDLTEARVSFDKLKHGVRIAEWLIENAPDDLSELAQHLRGLFAKEA